MKLAKADAIALKELAAIEAALQSGDWSTVRSAAIKSRRPRGQDVRRRSPIDKVLPE